jgi:arsenate reductase
MKIRKKILILYSWNSCRTQMTEGALRHFKGDECEAFSAGTRPSRANPTVSSAKTVSDILPESYKPPTQEQREIDCIQEIHDRFIGINFF